MRAGGAAGLATALLCLLLGPGWSLEAPRAGDASPAADGEAASDLGWPLEELRAGDAASGLDAVCARLVRRELGLLPWPCFFSWLLLRRGGVPEAEAGVPASEAGVPEADARAEGGPAPSPSRRRAPPSDGLAGSSSAAAAVCWVGIAFSQPSACGPCAAGSAGLMVGRGSAGSGATVASAAAPGRCPSGATSAPPSVLPSRAGPAGSRPLASSEGWTCGTWMPSTSAMQSTATPGDPNQQQEKSFSCLAHNALSLVSALPVNSPRPARLSVPSSCSSTAASRAEVSALACWASALACCTSWTPPARCWTLASNCWSAAVRCPASTARSAAARSIDPCCSRSWAKRSSNTACRGRHTRSGLPMGQWRVGTPPVPICTPPVRGPLPQPVSALHPLRLPAEGPVEAAAGPTASRPPPYLPPCPRPRQPALCCCYCCGHMVLEGLELESRHGQLPPRNSGVPKPNLGPRQELLPRLSPPHHHTRRQEP